VTRRFEPWVVVACLVIVVSPLLQGIARGSGVNVVAVLTALIVGGIVLAVYVRMLARTRRNLDP
jgi:uncharacterized membrane protein